MFLRCWFFWDVVQRRLVVCYDLSGQLIGPIGNEAPLTFKPIGYPEISVAAIQRNIPEERRSH
jgi:hypothetical protein